MYGRGLGQRETFQNSAFKLATQFFSHMWPSLVSKLVFYLFYFKANASCCFAFLPIKKTDFVLGVFFL